MANNHKVLISGIPPTLHKDALMTMLLEFGDMVTVFVRESEDCDGKKCGYVVYESKLECYRAIAELNGQPPNYLKMRYGGVAIDEGIDVSVKPEVSVFHSALFHGTQAKRTNNSRQLSRRFIHKTWGQVVVGELVESEHTSYHTSRKEHQVTGVRGRRKRGRGVNLRESMGTDGIRDYEASCRLSPGKQSPDMMTKSSYSKQFEETEDRCLYCGMVGDNSCGKCGATYCSEICLRKDWRMHKHDCVRVKNAGKESSPQSENIKHGKSSSSPLKEECLSENSYRKKSESKSYHTEQDEESDDSRDWLSVSESVDEETFIPPVQMRSGPTNSKKCFGKMGTESLNEKGAVRKRDSIRSEFISGKADGKFKHGMSPKADLLRGNTMLKDITEDRDNHLKYNSASPKQNSVKGNSCENRVTEKRYGNLNYRAKEDVAQEITVKSGTDYERKEDNPRNNSNIPAKNVAIGDSVEIDASKKRGNHLKCCPTPLEESVKTRISLECDNVKNENDPSKYTPTLKEAMHMRHTTPRDREFEKKDDCLKSFQSKNGVIKSHVKDTGCGEIKDGTSIERTISSGTPTSSARRFDIGNSFSFDWIKSSVVKSGNDLNSDAALRSQCDNISSPPDKSIGKQTKSQELALHPSKLASPVPEGIEKLVALQNQKKMSKMAQTGLGNEPMANMKSFEVPVPGGVEIQKVEKGVNQEMQSENGTVSKPARWNLVSDDPETEIAIYDLCTQQKKLPTESFLQVEILSLVNPGEYWVQPFDKEELHSIEKLMRNKKTSQSVFEADLGEYCCVRDGDVWYRGRILSIRETEFIIALIDFGKVISAKAEQLDDLPPIAKNFYAQAIRVRLDPRTPAEYLNCKAGTVHFMKAKGTIQDTGVTNVQLKGILYAQEVTVPMKLSLSTPEEKGDEGPSTADGSQWPSSVLCQLNEGDEASCTVLRIEISEEGYNDGAVVAIGFESIANELESILVDIQSDCSEESGGTVCNPVIGDLVAAFSPKLSCWMRSIVLDVGNAHWLVAGIDFGTVEEVTEIRDIPIEKSYRRIHALSAIFKVTSSGFAREDLFCEERIEENAKLFAKVLKKKEDSLECRLYSSNERTYCYVEMKAWSPKADCSPYETVDAKKRLPSPLLDVVSVTPGSPVIMLTYFDSLVVYVQPCDANSISIMEELHQIITNTARNNIPLKEDPVIGKKYICRYKGDMKYYRAIVERVKSPMEIYVHYIDFGNKEAVPRRHLYELPSECEEIPCYGVKIELKKDFDNTLNNSARKYLSYLIQDKKVLTLNFADGDLRNAELLFGGNSLSDNLKTLMNPV